MTSIYGCSTRRGVYVSVSPLAPSFAREGDVSVKGELLEVRRNPAQDTESLRRSGAIPGTSLKPRTHPDRFQYGLNGFTHLD